VKEVNQEETGEGGADEINPEVDSKDEVMRDRMIHEFER